MAKGKIDPEPEFAAPYEIVICSLEGPDPGAPPARRNHSSPVWVFALLKFFTPA